MSNFLTLVKFELKKIMKRKTAIITLIIMMLVMACMACMDIFFVDETGKSGYATMQNYREQSLLLNGRLIDDVLLREMRESFEGAGTPTDSAASDAMQHDFANPYRAVYVLTKSIVGAKNVFNVDAKTLYEARESYIENMWDEYYLTEGEKEYWRDKKADVATPFTYEYTYGSTKTIVEVYTCSVLMLLFVAVALAAVFSDEYNKGMDKLIMSTRYGKVRTYFAKISAGAVFAFAGALLMLLSGAVPTLLIYGAEGMDAAIQLYMEVSPFPMTVGEVLIAFFLIYLVAAFLYAALTMFFSQVFKNSITSMGIMVAFMLVEMCLSVPANLRVLAQIFDLLPSNVLAIWSLFDCKLVPWFGGYLTNLQFAPIAYVALTVVLVFLGKLIQRRREEV